MRVGVVWWWVVHSVGCGGVWGVCWGSTVVCSGVMVIGGGMVVVGVGRVGVGVWGGVVRVDWVAWWCHVEWWAVGGLLLLLVLCFVVFVWYVVLGCCWGCVGEVCVLVGGGGMWVRCCGDGRERGDSGGRYGGGVCAVCGVWVCWCGGGVGLGGVGAWGGGSCVVVLPFGREVVVCWCLGGRDGGTGGECVGGFCERGGCVCRVWWGWRVVVWGCGVRQVVGGMVFGWWGDDECLGCSGVGVLCGGAGVCVGWRCVWCCCVCVSGCLGRLLVWGVGCVWDGLLVCMSCCCFGNSVGRVGEVCVEEVGGVWWVGGCLGWVAGIWGAWWRFGGLFGVWGWCGVMCGGCDRCWLGGGGGGKPVGVDVCLWGCVLGGCGGRLWGYVGGELAVGEGCGKDVEWWSCCGGWASVGGGGSSCEWVLCCGVGGGVEVVALVWNCVVCGWFGAVGVVWVAVWGRCVLGGCGFGVGGMVGVEWCGGGGRLCWGGRGWLGWMVLGVVWLVFGVLVCGGLAVVWCVGWWCVDAGCWCGLGGGCVMVLVGVCPGGCGVLVVCGWGVCCWVGMGFWALVWLGWGVVFVGGCGVVGTVSVVWFAGGGWSLTWVSLRVFDGLELVGVVVLERVLVCVWVASVRCGGGTVGCVVGVVGLSYGTWCLVGWVCKLGVLVVGVDVLGVVIGCVYGRCFGFEVSGLYGSWVVVWVVGMGSWVVGLVGGSCVGFLVVVLCWVSGDVELGVLGGLWCVVVGGWYGIVEGCCVVVWLVGLCRFGVGEWLGVHVGGCGVCGCVIGVVCVFVGVLGLVGRRVVCVGGRGVSVVVVVVGGGVGRGDGGVFCGGVVGVGWVWGRVCCCVSVLGVGWWRGVGLVDWLSEVWDGCACLVVVGVWVGWGSVFLVVWCAVGWLGGVKAFVLWFVSMVGDVCWVGRLGGC
uniref:Uncharacterized protein n=1 Tax=Knipowitschia caucasica TaxID=637954 RepID=A0AAV2LCL7_KNICA